jgi:glycosyltransferase involved in cell wall biosynthesis
VSAPSISIITPSLNQAAFIERTLRSILDQGYERLEYLVVDGGSDDGSVEIIERYADRLAWWVSEPDSGQTDALNKALPHATGDVIGYVNSDDYLLPGALAEAAATFERTGASWVSGACRFVDEHDVLESVWTPFLPPGPRFSWMQQPWAVPQPASFWRRELFERLGPFREDMHYVFDTEFMLRLAYAGEMPGLTDQELAVRDVHSEAKSWDLEPFEREARGFDKLFASQLSPTERIQAKLGRVGLKLGLFKGSGRP